MSEALSEYFRALERLKDGRATKVPKGARINNDNVAQEAGRGKGSIKKSRAVFKDLIEAIDIAAAEQSSPERHITRRLEKTRGEAQSYREKWEQALCRELSLLQEVYVLKKELALLRGGNVLPLRAAKHLGDGKP
jgi:hypothetical protein